MFLFPFIKPFRKISCLLLMMAVLMPCVKVSAQVKQSLKAAEDSLESILKELNQAKDDSTREVLNRSFSEALYGILMRSDSDPVMFENIKTLIKISPDDGSFRILHWNLPGKEGKKRCYGFLKVLQGRIPRVFRLTDLYDSIEFPDTATLDPRHWYGALYYTSVTGTAPDGQKYYTLLGWAGTADGMSRKLIEVLWFDRQGLPRFGLPVFPNYGDGSKKRIIFGYSPTASMSLKYREQVIEARKKWNARKRVFETRSRDTLMIVFDHLVPLDPMLEGQHQFYVASGESSDAFRLVNGRWIFVPGMDSRNKP